jgi:hypothetical protein
MVREHEDGTSFREAFAQKIALAVAAERDARVIALEEFERRVSETDDADPLMEAPQLQSETQRERQEQEGENIEGRFR